MMRSWDIRVWVLAWSSPWWSQDNSRCWCRRWLKELEEKPCWQSGATIVAPTHSPAREVIRLTLTLTHLEDSALSLSWLYSRCIGNSWRLGAKQRCALFLQSVDYELYLQETGDMHSVEAGKIINGQHWWYCCFSWRSRVALGFRNNVVDSLVLVLVHL